MSLSYTKFYQFTQIEVGHNCFCLLFFTALSLWLLSIMLKSVLYLKVKFKTMVKTQAIT